MSDPEPGGSPDLLAGAAGTLPGRVRGYVWPTEFLVVADFLDASRHNHSALQLMVGIDGAVRMDFGDGWRSLHGALVDTDVAHAFDGSGGLFGGGWIESESPLGEGLRRVLGGREWAELDEEIATEIAASIAPCLADSVTCADAHRRWRSAVARLTGVHEDRAITDERILSVLQHLREAPRPPPRVGDLARLAHLSESRLQHLFREQVGVPIRRYLLWHRLLTAMGLVADGHGVTEAAHLSGFSDAAHLARTMRHMTGVATTELGPAALWLSNCR